jgi:hypothetical protein
MTKRVFVLAAVLALCGAARAAERQGSFEILLGNFRINDPLFETIYTNSGPIRGLAITAALFFHLDFYLEVKMFTQKGQLSFSRETTNFSLIPFSVGLRYRAPLGLIEPFIGAGLEYDIFYEKNLIGTAVDYARGTHFLAGVSLRPGRNFPIAVTGRLKYTQVKAVHNGRTIDLGGFEANGGLSLIF